MIEKVGQNLSPKFKQVGYGRSKCRDESPYLLQGERDVIRLRNPTEDKRALRRMLTSADRIRLNSALIVGCLVFRLISGYTGERLIPSLRRKDCTLRALVLAVTSLWPHKVGSRVEI